MNKPLHMRVGSSSIIAGCMKWGRWGANFSTGDYDRLIRQCLELGVTAFDHADIYGGYTTEEEFGRVLQQWPELRPKLQLISKCGICLVGPERRLHRLKHYDTRASHIRASVEGSLRKLHTDRLDLLLIHRPDPLMEPEEVAAVLQDLLQEGKILTAGVSNFSPSQMDLLQRWLPLRAHQMELSLCHTDPLFNGVFDRCRLYDCSIQAWSPLGGLFAGNANMPDHHRRILEVASHLSQQYEAGIDQILLAWLMHHPYGLQPVIGTTRLERIQAAIAAEQIVFTRQEWFQMLEASRGEEVP